MLGTREANHPVPRLNVDISVQVASQENHILLEPDVLMTRIDRVAWIVREIENAARFVIPSQDGESCPLGPHPDPTQGGRDGNHARRAVGRTGPASGHSLLLLIVSTADHTRSKGGVIASSAKVTTGSPSLGSRYRGTRSRHSAQRARCASTSKRRVSSATPVA